MNECFPINFHKYIFSSDIKSCIYFTFRKCNRRNTLLAVTSKITMPQICLYINVFIPVLIYFQDYIFAILEIRISITLVRKEAYSM